MRVGLETERGSGGKYVQAKNEWRSGGFRWCNLVWYTLV
jgi:hypothetical protein